MKKLFIMLVFALSPFFMACEDNNDDLWSAIDDLKNRVAALEGEVAKVNGNIEALKQLYTGTTINKVTKEGDKYIITLSNGEVIELAQGSKAEAVIPLIGISDEGFWQYSTDNGDTWISLNVKATAEDGKTPQFRIDEATGYWQVSYDGTDWQNVLNTAGDPVQAVGTGTVTDKFFDEVKVEGDEFVVKLKGSAEPIRIPIKPDFLCKITTTEAGVQKFNLSESKRYAVELKGVDETLVSAPEGWTATLSTPVNGAAELTVVAPATATRAEADSDKDVAILATSKGFAVIAKIQVELASVVAAPSVSVANSTSVVPTVNSLTFDVTVENADSWYYLVLPSSEPAPTAEVIISTGKTSTETSVTVAGLSEGVAYKFYAVAKKGDVKSEVASVENTTATATVTAKDFYQMYQDGQEFKLGAVTVNKTNFAEAKFLKITELNKDVFAQGGLIFVDNSVLDRTVIEATMTSMNVAADKDIVVVGRYEDKAQVVLNVPELRCNRNVTLANVTLELDAERSVSNLISNSNAKINPTLQLLNCTVKMGENTGRYTIYDTNPNFSFLDITVDNCVVCYNPKAKQPSLVQLSTTPKSDASKYAQREIKVLNSVIYAPETLKAHIVNLSAKSAHKSTNANITVKGNSIYNIYQPNVMVRADVAKNVIFTENVASVDYAKTGSSDGPTYVVCVYDGSVDGGLSTIENNYLYSLGTPKTDATAPVWKLVHGNNKVAVAGSDPETTSTIICNGDVKPEGNPFESVDLVNGIITVKKSVVTQGWGANYDSKLWMK